MCCVCQYFGAQGVDLDAIYDDCSDTNDGALDTFHDGCEWYNEFPESCGMYDDDDFQAIDMCCACADLEEEQLFFIDEDANIDIDAVDGDLITEDAQEELDDAEPVFETTDEPIAADEIEVEDLEQLDEDGWNNLLTEQIDPFNPAMNWADITEALQSFQLEQ